MAERSIRVNIVGDASSLERSFGRASRSATTFNRDLGRSTRGALAGSGVFRGLGRSIAFASGGFLAFASAGQFIRSSIDAAKEAVVTQRQLAAQFRASGKDLGVYQGEIDRTANRLSLLAGFQNDEVKAAFLTIFRTTGDVSKALRDTATAADLARAKHLGLAQAGLIVAKTEAGNTTLLRRQGFQISKNATAEQALAQLRQVIAGQAAAGTTAQERFGAVLHNTEEIIGTAILPTLNKYLASGSRWLEQMNESGRLQRDVSKATEGFASAMRDAATVVRDVDRVTGSFANTLELLVGLKAVSTVAGWAGAFRTLSKEEEAAGGRAALLKTRLAGLAEIGVITVGIDVIFHAKGVNEFLRDHLKGLAKIQDFEDKHNPVAHFLNRLAPDVGVNPPPQLVQGVAGGVGEHGALVTNAARRAAEAAAAANDEIKKAAAARPGLTAEQRNRFFDNALTRDLDRVQDLGLQQQVARLQQIAGLITKRIAATKDVTRKLNLEDDLVDVQRRTKDVRSQIAQNIKDRIDAQNAAAKERQALVAARNQASQFKALGLSGSGEQIIPLNVLKNELARLTKSVDGTLLDTKKTSSLFANIRKIFAGGFGAITAESKSQIKQMLDGIDQQLKNHQVKSQTAFKHLSAAAFASQIPNLSAAQRRAVEAAFSIIGPGGVVPGQRSLAFSGAGSKPIVVHTTVTLDGREVAKSVTNNQQRTTKQRSGARRGPYAGRH